MAPVRSRNTCSRCAIQTEFTLPPTSSPSFLYTILGGRIDRESPFIAVIKADGSVAYQQTGAR